MQPFKYKPPRVNSGDLRTPVSFYEFAPKDGPEPGEEEREVLYSAWAKIDSVWLKDLETAKANGTLTDLTITIRDPIMDYVPTNKHYISIDHPMYRDNKYNVKSVQPDSQNKDFITVIAELKQ